MLKLILLSLLLISCSSTSYKREASMSLLSKKHKKVLYDSIMKENFNALQAIVSMLPVEDRSKKDQGALNNALAMTIAKGSSCNKKIADYLFNAGARVSFTTVKSFAKKATNRRVYLMPLCGDDYITQSYFDFMKSVESHPEKTKVKDYLTKTFVTKSHNNFLAFINNIFPRVSERNEPYVVADLNRYTKLVVQSLKEGKDFCQENQKSDACVSVFLYHKTIEELKTQIDASKAKKLQEQWFKSLATIEQVYNL